MVIYTWDLWDDQDRWYQYKIINYLKKKKKKYKMI